MGRPIWTGTLSFGLLHVPVSLMAGERKVDLQFRMLDSRNNARVRYERVNAETGEEVPWKQIVKAFEYSKGSYVVLDADDIKAAAPEAHDAIEVESFVDATAIDPRYFEKPYVLLPGKKAEKGYVLLRETLKRSGRAGMARVIIRTREHLCMVLPHGDALVLLLLRYPQELVDLEDYRLPAEKPERYRITANELRMAEELISSMSGEWKPEAYHDEFRERLSQVIQERIGSDEAVAPPDETPRSPEGATTNVVDFMALLKKSLASKKRTPAKKQVDAEATRKSPAKKKTRKSATRTAAKKRGKAAQKAVKKAVKKAAKKATGKSSGRRKAA